MLLSVNFFILFDMDPNEYNYQCYYSYLQNQSLTTSDNSQNPLQYVIYRPSRTSENSQNQLQYVVSSITPY